MTNRKIYCQSIYWSYSSEPPIGFPKVLVEQFKTSNDGSVVTNFPEIQALYSQYKANLPKGYSLGWSCLNPPPKMRSDEFRATSRIRAMTKRILARYPLFADQFIEKELTEKSDYYSGTLDSDTLSFRSEIQADYAFALSVVDKDVVLKFEWWKHEAVFAESKFKPVEFKPQLKPVKSAHQFTLFEFLRPFVLEQFNRLRELYSKFLADLKELKNPLSRMAKVLDGKADSKIIELSARLKELKREIVWFYSVFELAEVLA